MIRSRATPAVSQEPAVTGFEFPSNLTGSDTSEPYVALEFAAPHNNGLPIWGPGGAGVTYIYKYRPTQQTGYYVGMWWSRGDGTFGGTTFGFWGAHPYPQSGTNSGTTHWWEIACNADNTFTREGPGNRKEVTKDQWHTQALKVVRAGASNKTLTFYTELPSVADGDIIEPNITASNYGETENWDTLEAKLTIGDSPWWNGGGAQHERLSGVLRHIKIFNIALSEADILLEAANDALVTTAGQNNIWYGKINPTSVDDLTCDFGTGRSFAWADAANKGTLWTEA